MLRDDWKLSMQNRDETKSLRRPEAKRNNEEATTLMEGQMTVTWTLPVAVVLEKKKRWI